MRGGSPGAAAPPRLHRAIEQNAERDPILAPPQWTGVARGVVPGRTNSPRVRSNEHLEGLGRDAKGHLLTLGVPQPKPGLRPPGEQVAIDQILMMLLSGCVLGERFALAA
jgi:hypothetical protein